MASKPLGVRFPHLFQPAEWPDGPIWAQFGLLDEPPPPDMISNINLVPRLGKQWVILLVDDGAGGIRWEIPGGTLEPGEHFEDTLRRELREEAGAELYSYQMIGAWHCKSLADKPYRPHLPHPESFRLVCFGEVGLIRKPAVPPGAELVVRVDIVPLEIAVARFRSIERFDLAELYELAAVIVSSQGIPQ